LKIPLNARILFQGDSITDGNRRRNKSEDMGEGYAALVAVWFSAMFPEKNATFINRGISGNKLVDLKKRWQKDCIDLKPDILSILIGINDVMYRFWEKPADLQIFEDNYRDILESAKKIETIKIVLMEPFFVGGENAKTETVEILSSRIGVIRKLAAEFKCTLIPLNSIFSAAVAKKREAGFWSIDGVHPTFVGHALIAQSWLNELL
jgi:acyl-CoA thioesterase-1